MSSIQCDIKLDDPNGNGVYYVGQTVSGSVTLNLSKSENVTRISATIQGFAYWRKVENQSKYASNKYEGREEYINDTYIVRPAQDYNIKLASGEHVYYFTSRLPRASPPSFESKLGHIRYRVLVVIERLKKSDIKRPVQFTVLIPLNLNAFDALIRQPKCAEKNYTFFFSDQHKLELKIELERTGFAIGDMMRISVDANNLSKSDINSICFTLDQIIVYATWQRCGKLITKREREEKHKERTGKLAQLTHTSFIHYMTIPYMPVPIFTSRVISMSYELTVLPSSQFTPLLIPIVIGNIPICNV